LQEEAATALLVMITRKGLLLLYGYVGKAMMARLDLLLGGQ
jgi:hypothetical protein